MTSVSKESPVWLNNHLRHRSRPADGVHPRLQNRKLAVHVVVHQSGALVAKG